MRIPVLAYRPMHLDGNDYRTNDLRALASDVRTLTEAGFSIVALRDVVDAWLDNRDRKSTRLNSSHIQKSRMPSSA